MYEVFRGEGQQRHRVKGEDKGHRGQKQAYGKAGEGIHKKSDKCESHRSAVIGIFHLRKRGKSVQKDIYQRAGGLRLRAEFAFL